MPLSEPGWPWLTQALTVEARLMSEVEVELLPVGRARLPGSPMLELLEIYVEQARQLVPHAVRMAAAWRRATPRPDDVGRWEESLVRENGPQALWPGVFAVRSTLQAATTGDVGH